MYSGASLSWTHVWEPIPILQQKVPHLSGNSVIQTVSLGRGVRISEARLYIQQKPIKKMSLYLLLIACLAQKCTGLNKNRRNFCVTIKRL